MNATLLLALLLAAADGPAGASPSPALPKPGDTVPALTLVDLSGAPTRVDFKGGDTVLVFFTSGCPHCHKMLPEWNGAFERKPAGLKMVGIIMDREPPGFFTAMPVRFPVLRSPGLAFAREMKIARVPLTVRVGPGGKVLDVGAGVLDPIRLGQLFRP